MRNHYRKYVSKREFRDSIGGMKYGIDGLVRLLGFLSRPLARVTLRVDTTIRLHRATTGKGGELQERER